MFEERFGGCGLWTKELMADVSAIVDEIELDCRDVIPVVSFEMPALANAIGPVWNWVGQPAPPSDSDQTYWVDVAASNVPANNLH